MRPSASIHALMSRLTILALLAPLAAALGACDPVSGASDIIATVEEFVGGGSNGGSAGGAEPAEPPAVETGQPGAPEEDLGSETSGEGGGGEPEPGEPPVVSAVEVARPVSLVGANLGEPEEGNAINIYAQDGELQRRLRPGNPRIKTWTPTEVKFSIPVEPSQAAYVSLTIQGGKRTGSPSGCPNLATFQHLLEDGGVVALGVPGPEEEAQGGVLGLQAPQLGQQFGPGGQLPPVTLPELGPPFGLVAEPAAQPVRGGYLLEPEVHPGPFFR
mgnify:CR=1 FL=1